MPDPNELFDTNINGPLDVTENISYAGTLRAATGGINKDWSVYLQADDKAIYGRDTGAAAAAALTTFQASRTQIWGKAYDATSAEGSMATVALPPDYNGAQLKVTLYWATGAAGTTGAVRWIVSGRCFAHDNTLVDSTAPTTVTLLSTFTTQKDLQVVQGNLTPNNFTASPCLLALGINRDATNGADTFDADAILIGILLAYA